MRSTIPRPIISLTSSLDVTWNAENILFCFQGLVNDRRSGGYFTIWTAFWAPWRRRASDTRDMRALLVLMASLPPLSTRPFAEAIDNAAIWKYFYGSNWDTCGFGYFEWDLITWGRQSGLASKMTMRSPIGTVICCNSKPSANSVRRTVLPTRVADCVAICLSPAEHGWIFSPVAMSIVKI